jgi:hypothetical protein
MCLTPELLAVFLNILGPEIVSTEPGIVTVHAEVGDARWVAEADDWCTDAPQAECAARGID